MKKNYKNFTLRFIRFIKNPLSLFFLIVIIISSITVYLWTGSGTYLMGHDVGYRFIVIEFFLSLFYTWSKVFHLGRSVIYNAAAAPIHFPDFLIGLFIKDPHSVQQILLIFWNIINFLPFIVGYYIFWPKQYRSSKWQTVFILAAFCYALNFFNLQGWSVFWRTRFSIQFLLPIHFFFLYETIASKRINLVKTIIVAAITAIFNGGGSPPLFGPLLLIWGVAIPYFSLLDNQKKHTTLLLCKTAVLSTMFFLGFSAFWIAPYMYYATHSYVSQIAQMGGIQSLVDWAFAISKNSAIINILRLQGLPSWDLDTPLHFILPYISNPLLIIGSFIFPILSFAAIILAKSKGEKKIIIYVGILLFLGLFFSAGTQPPTGNIFVLLIRYLPGFGVFRTPYFKFGPLVFFAVSFLVGYAVTMGTQSLKKPKYSFKLIRFVPAIFIIFVIFYHFPLIRGDFFDFNRPFLTNIKPPEYTIKTAQFLNSSGSPTSRILLLPPLDPFTQGDGYNWGYWSPDELPRMLVHKTFVVNRPEAPAIVQSVYNALLTQNVELFRRLSEELNIDTILWRDDILFLDKTTTSKNFDSLKNFLYSIPDIKKTYENGPWKVLSVGKTPVAPFTANSVPVLSDIGFSETVQLNGEASTSAIFLIPTDFVSLPEKEIFLDPISIEMATCFCDSNPNLMRLDFPPANIVPGDTLYFLISRLENKSYAQSVLKGQNSSSLLLQLATRRLSELRTQFARTDSSDSMIALTIKAYSSLIEKAYGELSDLATIEKLKQSIVMLKHLEAHADFLANIDTKGKASTQMSVIFDIVGKTILTLKKQTYNNDATTHYTFLYEVKQPGTFNINLFGLSPTNKISLGTREIKSEEKLFLSPGTYEFRSEKIPISLPSDLQTIMNKKLDIQYGDVKDVYLVDVIPNMPYQISFDYVSDEGIAPIVSLENKTEKITIVKKKLLADDNSHSETLILPAQTKPLPFVLSISACCYSQTGAKVTFSNLKITPLFVPELVLRREGSSLEKKLPIITSEIINPTLRKVNVNNASDPFFLVFHETFDPNWIAHILPESIPTQSKKNDFFELINFFPKELLTIFQGTEVQSNRHVIANTYANAWIISKKGNYTIILEYRPQRYVYVGISITLLTGAFSMYVLLHERKKYK